MSRRGFGRRRTVLQLEDGPNKSYGFGYRPGPDRPREGAVVGGLDMTHYEDSDEEGEEDARGPTSHQGRTVQKFVASSERLEPSPVSPNEPTTSGQVTAITNGRSVSPDTTKPKDEIDSKVLDFLAELDAIDGPDTTSGGDQNSADSGGLDGEPMARSPRSESDGSEYSDDSTDGSPTEPTSDWQQCLDDGTQCYYYWHQVTNEVTWEIPPEYSQYLLRYREYEEQLAKYNREAATGNRPKPQKRRRRKKQKTNDRMAESSHCSDHVPTGPSEFPYPSSTVPEPHEAPVYPPLPPLPPTERQHIPTPPPPEPLVSAVSQSSGHVSPRPPVIGPQLAPPPPPPDDPKPPAETLRIIGPELPSSSSVDLISRDADDDSLSDEMDVDEYVHRKLEEPVSGRYVAASKRSEGVGPQHSEDTTDRNHGENKVVSSVVSYGDDDQDRTSNSEDSDLDIDDIDRELEKALEQKQAELQSKEVDSNTKRKAPVEGPVDAAASTIKKRRIDDDSKNVKEKPAGSALKHHVKEKVETLAEVIELSGMVMDKLDFLDVTKEGLSKLQVLLIQIQTRVEDWREGGILTPHLVRKLRDAAKQLEAYEENAAPTNWSCHWDRKFKRYFYCNELTDQTQWDYPTDPVPEPPLPASTNNQDRYRDVAKTTDDVSCDSVEQNPAPSSDYSSAAPDYAATSDPVPCAYGGDISHLLAAPPPPPPPPPSDDNAVPSCSPKPPATMDMTEGLPSLSSTLAPEEYLEFGPQLPRRPSCHDEDEDVDGVAMEMSSPGESLDTNHGPDESAFGNDSGMASTEKNGVDSETHHRRGVGFGATESMLPQNKNELETQNDRASPSYQLTASYEAPLGTLPAEGGSSQDGTASGSVPSAQTKEKKRKKDKSLVGRGISMKKKNVPGLVEKWQKVQKEVEAEIAHQKKALMEEQLKELGNG